MTCQVCGAFAPDDPATGYAADAICPACAACGYHETAPGEFADDADDERGEPVEQVLAFVPSRTARVRVYEITAGRARYLGVASEADYCIDDDRLGLVVEGKRVLVTLPTCDQCGAAFERADGGLRDRPDRESPVFCDEECRTSWRHCH